MKQENTIANLDQLLNNLETVENYLTEGTDSEFVEMSKYIKRGTCFVAYSIEDDYRFAPSKILGYKDNTLKNHKPSNTDGRVTNKAITKILKSDPEPNDFLESKYLKYCEEIGSPANKTGGYGAPRKYWVLKLKQDFKNNLNSSEEFPEGKIIERLHKARERNSKVVQLAKANFKNKHGILFCQVCSFNFEDKYGTIGEDFIEAHHLIPVSKMKWGHKTKPEDIALICPNCHRMVHKKRPWLSLDDLNSLLKTD